MKETLFTLSLFAVFYFNAYAQTLDSNFGTNGIANTDIGSVYSHIYSLAQQKDDKIVAVGALGFNNYAIARYKNGILDNSFSSDGVITGTFGKLKDALYAVLIQEDNKIIVAGNTSNGTNLDMVLARFNVNGTPDKTFGTDGLVIPDFGDGDQVALALAFQSDGKILIAGHSGVYPDRDFALARYNRNGTLDNTFATGGKLTISLNPSYDWINAILVQPDGKILATGSTLANKRGDFATIRFNPDGSLDKDFGTNGIVLTNIGIDDEATSILMQPDGKIIVGGFSQQTHENIHNGDEGTGYDFALVRYHSNGTLDLSFDNNGIALLYDYNKATGILHSLILQPNGKIIASGSSSSYDNAVFIQMIRYNADGSVDKDFGKDGFYNLKGYSATSMIKQNDGKLVLAGYSYITKPKYKMEFASARFIVDELTIDNPVNTRDEVFLFPNPTNGALTLELNLANQELVSMDLIDINGKLIDQIKELDSKAINTIELKYHVNGIYFYKLYSDSGFIKTGKIIIFH